MTTLITPTNTASPAPAPATDWAPFRALLDTQRADCVRQRELALAETATSVPDPVAVNRAATLLRTIEDIDAALERIAAGTYGVCVHCKAAIPAERLEFRPFAAACVSCQQTR
jgi:RNA polymerase-binding transcription factor DksA